MKHPLLLYLFFQAWIILLFLGSVATFAKTPENKIPTGFSAINNQDSITLVELYNSTAGANWTFNTNWLKGPVSSWHGIKVSDNRVTEINIFSNNMVGPIPPSIKNLTELTSLVMYGNLLNGSIPAELGQLNNLTTLYLHSNRLTGAIPPELGQLKNLKYFYLYSNQLSGSIPAALGQLNSLQRLYLHYNQLSGTIPPQLGNLPELTYLYLNNNQLSGSIPPEFGQLSKLYLLQMQYNKLSGDIPPELGQLTNLTYLYLHYNNLSGAIPPELGNMTNMHYLQLNNNALRGEIPATFGQLLKLRNLYLEMNQLYGALPAELGQLSLLQNFNVSVNNIEGEIPPELGQLTSLITLNLSINQLSGNIPPELGNLVNLTQLTLELNYLKGDIPKTFNNLAKLESLKLSLNQLTGFLADSLDWLPNLSNISVYYNNLTFEDLENKTGLFEKYFYYSPQYKIGQGQLVSIDTGVNFTLETSCGGTGNLYQWHFNGQPLGNPINEPTYDLKNISGNMLGRYYCLITNPVVPNLIIESEPITLQLKTLGKHPPTDIYLTTQSIEENLPVGTEVGTLATEDKDLDDTHFYSLIEGEDANDNRSFFIAGNQLFSAEEFDFEIKNTYTIRIQTTDRAGNTLQKPFVISIIDKPEMTPYNIILSNNSIAEDVPVGYQIGVFTTESDDQSHTANYTYTLVSGEGDDDNSSFFIAANQLHTNTIFNYEQKNTLFIRVQTEDKYQSVFSKSFTILINEVVKNNHLLIPDAFSPNGDGKNDYFVIPGLDNFPEAEMKIYNRYGTLVYYHQMSEANIIDMSNSWWDGRMNANGQSRDKVLPQGFYFLVLKTDQHTSYNKTIYLKE